MDPVSIYSQYVQAKYAHAPSFKYQCLSSDQSLGGFSCTSDIHPDNIGYGRSKSDARIDLVTQIMSSQSIKDNAVGRHAIKPEADRSLKEEIKEKESQLVLLQDRVKKLEVDLFLSDVEKETLRSDSVALQKFIDECCELVKLRGKRPQVPLEQVMMMTHAALTLNEIVLLTNMEFGQFYEQLHSCKYASYFDHVGDRRYYLKGQIKNKFIHDIGMLGSGNSKGDGPKTHYSKNNLKSLASHLPKARFPFSDDVFNMLNNIFKVAYTSSEFEFVDSMPDTPHFGDVWISAPIVYSGAKLYKAQGVRLTASNDLPNYSIYTKREEKLFTIYCFKKPGVHLAIYLAIPHKETGLRFNNKIAFRRACIVKGDVERFQYEASKLIGQPLEIQ